jgi:hypothetical protein
MTALLLAAVWSPLAAAVICWRRSGAAPAPLAPTAPTAERRPPPPPPWL